MFFCHVLFLLFNKLVYIVEYKVGPKSMLSTYTLSLHPHTGWLIAQNISKNYFNIHCTCFYNTLGQNQLICCFSNLSQTYIRELNRIKKKRKNRFRIKIKKEKQAITWKCILGKLSLFYFLYTFYLFLTRGRRIWETTNQASLALGYICEIGLYTVTQYFKFPVTDHDCTISSLYNDAS